LLSSDEFELKKSIKCPDNISTSGGGAKMVSMLEGSIHFGRGFEY
jgi:hypothetical protein